MKQKLLSILALTAALFVTQGAWADELTSDAIFNLTTVGDGTATVGTFETSGITKTAETAWTLNGTTPYITINLTEPLKAGDVIEISGKSNSSGKYFRFYNSTTFGSDYAGAEIGIGTSEGVKQVVVAEPSTATNTLIGKTTIYMNYSSSSNNGTVNYIKVLKGTNNAITANKSWTYTGYNAPTSATAADFVNSDMRYGKGIKMQTSANFQEEDKSTTITSALLNLNYDHSAGFDAANGGFIMFKLPANSEGTITIKYIPSSKTTTSSYNRILGYKIGSDAEQTITNKGYRYVISENINFDVTNESDVYFYNKSPNNADCFIYSVEVTFTAPTVSISTTANYSTYCSGLNLDFSATGATVYKAQASGTTVTLTEVDGGKVPAGTGIMLYKDGGGDVTPTVIESATAIADNDLVGVTAETTVSYGPTDGKYNYIFQKQGEELGFYKATGAKIRANRAYLSTTVNVEAGPTPAPKLNIVFNNAGTTAISDELKVDNVEPENKVYYNLAGQRVANPTKGLYIVNGKKVIIK